MLNHFIKGYRYVGLRGKLSRRRVNTQNAQSYNHWLSDKGEIHSYVRMQQGYMVAYGFAGVIGSNVENAGTVSNEA
ncbi:hypothetical protein BGX38DRAFT_1273723 [Terfezia claveryi]|nr:hypothetical protein BGX38DRAFT_1277644 [Terfezia claveryi]KAF8438230.1 hypothetical protein BGX38DRAFT_1273723 [Terfezia claveryi]